MARSNIVTLPTHLLGVGQHVLRHPCSDVPLTVPGVLEQCKEIAVDLYYAMMSNCGTALAAPQAGYTWSIVVINDDPRVSPSPLVLLNPKIVWKSETMERDREVCLSVPGYEGQVERATAVDVAFVDLHGEAQQVRFEGYGARVIQHELDHLDGRLYMDHSSTCGVQETQPGFWRRSQRMVDRVVGHAPDSQ